MSAGYASYAFEPRSAARRFLSANTTVYNEGDPRQGFLRVEEGAVRLVRYAADGRRHVLGFAFAGDLVGAPFTRTNSHDLETITASSFRPLAQDAPEAEAELARQRLNHMETQAFLLGRSCALERVAGFVILIHARLCAEEIFKDGARVWLPMDRRDIADYLGLTIETVSRRLTSLREAGYVELSDSRTVIVIRAAGVRRCAAGALGCLPVH
jgi:CRP/FNR family transcriptional regulator